MKAKIFMSLVITAVVFVFTSGCDRDAEYRIKLTENERITEKSQVLVDNHLAGFVKELRLEAGDRVAVLELTDKRIAQEQLKVGTVRVVEDGRIQLRTDSVRPGSPVLPAGSFIPTRSKAEFTIKKYATQQTFVLVGIVLVAILVLCLVFKSAFNLGLVILCLALAGFTGWILHPHLVPHIEKFYADSPATHDNTGAKDEVQPSKNRASVPVKEWEAKIVQVLEHRPNSRVIAFAAILVLSFIPYAILLGSVIRFLRRAK